jgi:hypothetical protein
MNVLAGSIEIFFMVVSNAWPLLRLNERMTISKTAQIALSIQLILEVEVKFV